MFTVHRAGILLALLSVTGLALAAGLRPDQQAAVERMLAELEPAKREAARAQIEQSVAGLSPAVISMLVNNLDSKQAGGRASQSSIPQKKRQATAEDLAYNRAQYEPALRRNWQLQRDFDEFVDAQLKDRCPDRNKYAVYAIAERYELRELKPEWFRGTDSADINVSIYEGSRAPKDGRYDFNFSKVRVSFDKQAIANAIATACADWSREAAEFHDKSSAHMKAGQSAAVAKAERAGNARIDAIAKALLSVIETESPSPDMALENALSKPKPVG
jgi:hypothetical protein